MNRSNDETVKSVSSSVTQSQQQSSSDQSKQTWCSENEASIGDSPTDEQSSSTSDHTTSKYKKSKTSKNNSVIAGTTVGGVTGSSSRTATQFSVERSDADGLRMKISAIRPTVVQVLNTASRIDEQQQRSGSKKSSKHNNNHHQSNNNNNNNNNNNETTIPTIEPLKGSKKRHTTTELEKIASPQKPPIETKMTDETIKGGMLKTAPASTAIQKYTKATANIRSPSRPPSRRGTSKNSNESGGINKSNKSKVRPSTPVAAISCLPQPPIAPKETATVPPCLSDATESGCSEATTTTTIAAKKVKVKRKKAPHKINTGTDQKKSMKKPRSRVYNSTDESDEDDDQPLKPLTESMTTTTTTLTVMAATMKSTNNLNVKALQNHLQHRHQPQQRTQRFNSKANNAPQVKPLLSAAIATGPNAQCSSDHLVGLSSSDNELPELVSAAIKRVESDTDDTVETAGSISFRKGRVKQLPQYQSTLLQDFMVKTQMLGQTTTTTTSPTTSTKSNNAQHTLNLPSAVLATKLTRTDLLANQNSNSQSESVASSAGVASPSKKRRGRPKKVTEATVTNVIASSATNINESADSGVVSTTSTNQSTSPSPKISASVVTSANTTTSMKKISSTIPATTTTSSSSSLSLHHRQRRSHQATITCDTNNTDRISDGCESATTMTHSPAATKPKIDMAYLDKRMYATAERVLYPPPRNKRRQSMSAATTTTAIQKNSTTTAGENKAKEELLLDPVWRKIDVNKKFRRPSLCGYKSDGGGGDGFARRSATSGGGSRSAICSKVLAVKSGYVSDYGSCHPRSSHHHRDRHGGSKGGDTHNSGYKSDASGKSRYSAKSCASRRSRAKSCGYRSDCKESSSRASMKSTKFRRKRRSSMFLRIPLTSVEKSLLNDEQDILQLAGLSLGQSSEESNEYVCKPSLEQLPTTSVSKKYGEINRFVTTGEYFGRGSSAGGGASSSLGTNAFAGLAELGARASGAGTDGGGAFVNSLTSATLPLRKENVLKADGEMSQTSRKIKSRRSSVASYCSSHYSGTSKVRRRRRRKSFRFLSSSAMGGKCGGVVDSKLLTDIEIITTTFNNLCRIYGSVSVSATGSGEKGKTEKALAEGGKQLIAALGGSGGGGSGKREGRDKRAVKKRKMSENLDFALLSAAAASGSGLTPNGGGLGGGTSGAGGGGSTGGSGSSKRRHKKGGGGSGGGSGGGGNGGSGSNGSSPDDHKLPLKKRHYLLTPGEKSTEAAVAVAAKLFASNVEAWAAAAALAKSTASSKSQLQFNATHNAGGGGGAGASGTVAKDGIGGGSGSKSSKTGLTPKKRHLLQNSPHATSSIESNAPLRIVIDGGSGTSVVLTSTGSSKTLDVSPASTAGSHHRQSVESHNKKRSRLEGLVSKIAHQGEEGILSSASVKDSPASIRNNRSTAATAGSIVGVGISVAAQLDSETSCPPPGVFEPSVELEIQIPPITSRLNEASSSAIITKSEVESPSLLGEVAARSFAGGSDITKLESASGGQSTRVVESLLNKTGGNLLLKRKRKKINRTGFPTVRRKKRKINENLLLDVTPDIVEQVQHVQRRAASARALQATATNNSTTRGATPLPVASLLSSTNKPVSPARTASCGSPAAVPRTPRLSVVSLERLQGTTPDKKISTSKTLISGGGERPRSTCRKRRTEEEILGAESALLVTDKVGRRTTVLPRAADDVIQSEEKPKISLGRARGRKNIPESIPSPLPLNRREQRKLVADVKVADAAPSVNPKRRTPLANPVKSIAAIGNKPALNKNSVQRIITAKLLENKVKLPAGIDPNTNFRCKIRLNRRFVSEEVGLGIIAPIPSPPSPTPTAEEVARDSAAKDISCDYPEQDILPRMDSIRGENANDIDSRTSSATDINFNDEKAAVRRLRTKKTYLSAGLFSDHFKVDGGQSITIMKKTNPAASIENRPDEVSDNTPSPSREEIGGNGEISMELTPQALLPPPPYCERFFRRTEIDFQLPYDIWWAYKNAKLPARVTVPSWNYRKIRTNIYPEAVRPNLAGVDLPICNCRPDTGCGDNCLNRLVYTECSPSNCPARERCTNQKIQRHEVAPGVERFMTTDKGWGVRTKLPIAKGTYILEYVGEVVTEREFKERMAGIYLKDTHHYCLHLDGGLVIDGHRMGSDGRFVNHSCMPNCEMQKWSVNGLSRMSLFAKRLIEPGEELSYDYNFALFNPAEGQECRCKTPQCRGVIGGKSQRIKPLPTVEGKLNGGAAGGGGIVVESLLKDGRNDGRQRKRKARKNTERMHAKEVAVARVQQLSEKEKKLVKHRNVFLVRNFEKIRRCRARRSEARAAVPTGGTAHSVINPAEVSPASSGISTPLSTSNTVNHRRPPTPNSSFAAQITAICTQRNIKTRGLTAAVQDPELEKMAKMAVMLRGICTALEQCKGEQHRSETVAVATTEDSTDGVLLTPLSQPTAKFDPNENKSDNVIAINGPPFGSEGVDGSAAVPALNNNKSKKKLVKQQHLEGINLKAIQANIEQGHYKEPDQFDIDMQRLFAEAFQAQPHNLDLLQKLKRTYNIEKFKCYGSLVALLGSEEQLINFQEKTESGSTSNNDAVIGEEMERTNKAIVSIERTNTPQPSGTPSPSVATPISMTPPPIPPPGELLPISTPNEDIIRCICGLYKDEGLMIQCARCMVWQHTECTKADIKADNYHCERCDPRLIDYEIPLEDFTDEGYRYYLTLMRGQLHVRQGDAVYVLRDIPIRDGKGRVVQPQKKHTYETIGEIDYNECDIFRVERLWKDNTGKRFIFGHHFLRPHETFHEPSRRFYPNEVVRVPLYEVVPIELVIGRCFVLDRTTFCKGRPCECVDEAHCYICELRVDKSARFFSKAKVNYPTCTKGYAFRKFVVKLRISKTYAPHEVDPAMLKTKKQKADNDSNISVASSEGIKLSAGINGLQSTLSTAAVTMGRQESNRSINAMPYMTAGARKRIGSKSPSTVLLRKIPTNQTVKQKRAHLENVLKGVKLKRAPTSGVIESEGPAIDLTYLLTGRGARQRKTINHNDNGGKHD